MTTVNAAVQRVPPRKLFAGRALRLVKGEAGNLDRLRGFLEHNGYNRTDTVREPGEPTLVKAEAVRAILPTGLGPLTKPPGA